MGGGSEAQATDQVSGVRKSNGQASCTYQPNPAGGPPTIPQALNRYAATAVGQPGVYQAADEDLFVSLLGATGQNALSAGIGMALEAYAYNLTGELFIQANNQLLARAGYQHLFRRVLPPGRGNDSASGLRGDGLQSRLARHRCPVRRDRNRLQPAALLAHLQRDGRYVLGVGQRDGAGRGWG